MTPADGTAVKVMPHVLTDMQTAVFGPSPISFIFTVCFFFFFQSFVVMFIFFFYFFIFFFFFVVIF